MDTFTGNKELDRKIINDFAKELEILTRKHLDINNFEIIGYKAGVDYSYLIYAAKLQDAHYDPEAILKLRETIGDNIRFENILAKHNLTLDDVKSEMYGLLVLMPNNDAKLHVAIVIDLEYGGSYIAPICPKCYMPEMGLALQTIVTTYVQYVGPKSGTTFDDGSYAITKLERLECDNCKYTVSNVRINQDADWNLECREDIVHFINLLNRK